MTRTFRKSISSERLKVSINEDNLRGLFICIKNYVNKNCFKFKISELRENLINMGFNLGITKIKTALSIFKELELVKSSIDGDVITITRDKNFYSKCNLEDSIIYLKETGKLNDRK